MRESAIFRELITIFASEVNSSRNRFINKLKLPEINQVSLFQLLPSKVSWLAN